MTSIHIIGAGLSGSLLGILLAKKGWDVQIFERRPDRRKESVEAGRSINLAVSVRGMTALAEAGLNADIQAIATKMQGRMNHPLGSGPVSMRYSVNEENGLFSVSRGRLNEMLMDAAEKAGAKIFFKEQCEDIDFDANTLTFLNTETQTTHQVAFERVVACDGANSAIRKAMTRNPEFQHTQDAFPVNYKELCIPADGKGEFLMDPNWLHIWGRDNGDFMMIALPNLDGSFTCTLFMPVSGEKSIASLNTPEKVQPFFETYFPDVLPLMPSLMTDYFSNPTSPLNIVKCYPWRVGEKMALVGDACHAVVPFYGQGVNASFEDCIELSKCIDQYFPDWEKVFEQYQLNRKANSDAISQMAAENYADMAKSGMLEFQLRKSLELELEKRFSSYKSQYELVSFSTVPYSQAQQQGWKNQDTLTQIIENLASVKEKGLENALQNVGVKALVAEVNWEEVAI
ncbi:MAG: FAD-dependent oxidoreductase [Bacteroidia bacterium]